MRSSTATMKERVQQGTQLQVLYTEGTSYLARASRHSQHHAAAAIAQVMVEEALMTGKHLDSWTVKMEKQFPERIRLAIENSTGEEAIREYDRACNQLTTDLDEQHKLQKAAMSSVGAFATTTFLGYLGVDYATPSTQLPNPAHAVSLPVAPPSAPPSAFSQLWMTPAQAFLQSVVAGVSPVFTAITTMRSLQSSGQQSGQTQASGPGLLQLMPQAWPNPAQALQLPIAPPQEL